jgi:hypothetical protein
MTVLPTRLAELTASEINLWCVLLISPEWRIEKRRRPPPSNSYPGGLMAVGATIDAMMKATGWQVRGSLARRAVAELPSNGRHAGCALALSETLPGRKSRIKVRHLRGAPVLQGFG